MATSKKRADQGPLGAEDLLELSRRIEALANEAAEEIEAKFFALAKELRDRAAPRGVEAEDSTD